MFERKATYFSNFFCKNTVSQQETGTSLVIYGQISGQNLRKQKGESSLCDRFAQEKSGIPG